jgi:predicted RNA-binding protein associated with RNAse of E/G family
MTDPTTTTLTILKYDGSLRARLPVHRPRRQGAAYVAELRAGDPVESVKPVGSPPETTSLRYSSTAYMFEDRWYHVQRVHRDGRLWYYVDAGMPLVVNGDSLSFVDMDLDVSWYPGEDPQLLDEDEFLAHAQLMRYPQDVIERTRAAMDEVLELIRRRAFPFGNT